MDATNWRRLASMPQPSCDRIRNHRVDGRRKTIEKFVPESVSIPVAASGGSEVIDWVLNFRQVVGEWHQVANVAMPIITTIGFVFLYIQIRGARWAAQNAYRAAQNQARAQAYSLGTTVSDILIRNPGIRARILGRTVPPTVDVAALNEQVPATCEMLCDFFEFIYAERDVIGREVHDAWRAYIIGMFKDSEVLRDFFSEHAQIYTKELRNIYEDALRELGNPSPELPATASKSTG